MSAERYYSLNGLRVFSMIGILIMHVLNNLSYCNDLPKTYFVTVKFGELTSLFMMISAFSISCGYYEKIKNGGFEEVIKFYKRRYSKILPFFAFLTLIDLVMHFSFGNFAESFANITLFFGMIPHEHITVIGVGWTLGVIFVFYLLYPFFVFLMSNKKIFLVAFLSAALFTFVFNNYFGIGKVDFIYCAIYFFMGCAIYLFRNDILRYYNRWVVLSGVIISTIVYYYTELYEIKFVLLTMILIYAIGLNDNKTILNNKMMTYLNGISLEIYLCHMFIFRVIELLDITKISNNLFLSFCITCVVVFIGTVVFSKGFQFVQKYIRKRLETK